MPGAANHRYLTKSRFMLAVECPTKLDYTDDKACANTKLGDPFVEALADGGFQVGALARLMFPGGTEVRQQGDDDQVRETARLLDSKDAIVYEAAVRYARLFVRIDILVKTGNALELIEVKAKSFDGAAGPALRTARGAIRSDMRPYLQDIAFQRYVLGLAYPGMEVTCSLLMADKSRVCTVDGLNQRFKVRRRNNHVEVDVAGGTDAASIGAPILARIDVDDLVEEILRVPLQFPGGCGRVAELAATWSEHYAEGRRIPPVIGAQCGSCEFRADLDEAGKRSGFHECWKEALGWSDGDFASGTVLDLWNFRKKDDLIKAGITRLSQVTPDHLDVKPGERGLSPGERHSFQAFGRWPGNGEFYLARDLVADEMRRWNYPLHFIDFETARVALPFHAGRHPYELIAFQFSHHVAARDGSVAHRSEFLEAQPGRFPNYAFVRELRRAVGTQGSVFIWSQHENTSLNAILGQLDEDPRPPADAADLRAFILSLTAIRADGKPVRAGARQMVDLCDLAQRAFFHPATKGSSSIKKVLPAVLGSSAFLRERYGRPGYGTAPGIPSRNFKAMTWYVVEGGKVVDPYALLPPVFADLPDELRAALSRADDGMEIAEGGAATMAYSRLQFEDLDPAVRDSIERALRKYCELDTLAMVMVYEAWREWLSS